MGYQEILYETKFVVVNGRRDLRAKVYICNKETRLQMEDVEADDEIRDKWIMVARRNDWPFIQVDSQAGIESVTARERIRFMSWQPAV